MKILHQVHTLNKQDGGPSRSIPGLCNAQIDLGHDVTLFTQATNIERNINFNVVCASEFSTRAELKTWIKQFDVIHIHAMWLSSNHQIAKIARELKIPYFFQPRGLLQKWAMKQGRLKKKVAWLLYQANDLNKSSGVISTADIETEDVKYFLPKIDVFQISNGYEDQGHPKTICEGEEKQALFISRVHHKKGIQDLLPAWCKLAPSNWKLKIAGPDEDGFIEQFRQNFDFNENRIEYIGQVDGKEKANLYRNSDLMILPTYSENFGLVVPEALSVGTAVLTTTGTPWTMLDEIDCGWCIEPGSEAINEALPKVLSTSKGRLFEMGQKGVNFARKNYAWDNVAKSCISVYSEALK